MATRSESPHIEEKNTKKYQEILKISEKFRLSINGRRKKKHTKNSKSHKNWRRWKEKPLKNSESSEDELKI